jgi:hypothetical protein
MLVCSACPVLATTASMEVLRVTEATFTTNAGAKTFSVTANAGTLLIEQLNLVDFEAAEETPFIAEPIVFDFVDSASLSIPPVIVAATTYEQVHVIPAREPLTLSMQVSVELSNDAVVDGIISIQLPFAEEQQIDALATFAAGDKKTMVLVFNPARLFDEVDFDLVSNGADFTIDANSADPNVVAAFDAIVENVFSSFGFSSFQ